MKTWLRVFTVLAVVVALVGLTATAQAASMAARVYWNATPAATGTVSNLLYGAGKIFAAGNVTVNAGGADFAVTAIAPRTGKGVWSTTFWNGNVRSRSSYFIRAGVAAGADNAAWLALQPNNQRLFAAGWLNEDSLGDAFTLFAINPANGAELWRWVENDDWTATAKTDRALGVASTLSTGLPGYTVNAVGTAFWTALAVNSFTTRIFDATGPLPIFPVNWYDTTFAGQANAVTATQNAVAGWFQPDEVYFSVGRRLLGDVAGARQGGYIRAEDAAGFFLWDFDYELTAAAGASTEFLQVAYNPTRGEVYAVGSSVDPGCLATTGNTPGTCRQLVVVGFDAFTGAFLWDYWFDMADFLYPLLAGSFLDWDDVATTVATNGPYVVVGGYGALWDHWGVVGPVATGPSRDGVLIVIDAGASWLAGFGIATDVKLYHAKGAPPFADQINSVALLGNQIGFGGLTTSPLHSTQFLTGYALLGAGGVIGNQWMSEYNPALGLVADQVNSVVFAGTNGKELVGGGVAGGRFYVQDRYTR